MKTKQAAFLLSASLIITASFSYAKPVEFKPSSESRIWISGVSTLHPFIIKASTFSFQMSFDAIHEKDASKEILKDHSARLTITVPVKGLMSEFEAMDANTQKAMKASSYPNVVFSLNSYSVAASGKIISVPGSLAISGVSKSVTLNASIHVSGSALSISGSQPIKMSDYGIKPPTMMFGSIKVDDLVMVHYHLILNAGKLSSDPLSTQNK